MANNLYLCLLYCLEAVVAVMAMDELQIWSYEDLS